MTSPSPRRTIKARGAILAVVIVAMLLASVYPLTRWASLKGDIARLEQEAIVLEDAIAAAQADRDLLNTDAEVMRLARERLNFVLPGETPFVLLQPEELQEPPEQIVPESGDDGRSVVQRWWSAMGRALRVS